MIPNTMKSVFVLCQTCKALWPQLGLVSNLSQVFISLYYGAFDSSFKNIFSVCVNQNAKPLFVIRKPSICLKIWLLFSKKIFFYPAVPSNVSGLVILLRV